MLACDKFLFLHLHKSGGTFVNELMLRCLPGARRLGYHLPYRHLPAEFSALPVLMTVRHPLAYYVSWYHFQLGLPRERRNVLFNIVSGQGALAFPLTIERLVGLADDPSLRDAVRDALPRTFAGHGLNLTGACLDELHPGTGFYTFLYRRMLQGAAGPTIIKAETMRHDLQRFLGPMFERTLSPWRDFLAAAPDMNRSRHGEVMRYYDRPLAEKIRTRDAAIFDTHGYDDHS